MAEAQAYFLALAAISTTFVGFSALIMLFRQALGGGVTQLDSWITLVFVQLGFLVTAGSLAPPLLRLVGLPEPLIWRGCSLAAGAVMAIFTTTYPRRRRAVAGAATPIYAWIDLTLLLLCTAVLLANGLGWPWRPFAGALAVGLTGVFLVATLGYLHALGALHRQAAAVWPRATTPTANVSPTPTQDRPAA